MVVFCYVNRLNIKRTTTKKQTNQQSCDIVTNKNREQINIRRLVKTK